AYATLDATKAASVIGHTATSDWSDGKLPVTFPEAPPCASGAQIGTISWAEERMPGFMYYGPWWLPGWTHDSDYGDPVGSILPEGNTVERWITPATYRLWHTWPACRTGGCKV